jgi:hypothetical protein
MMRSRLWQAAVPGQAQNILRCAIVGAARPAGDRLIAINRPLYCALAPQAVRVRKLSEKFSMPARTDLIRAGWSWRGLLEDV